MGKTIPRKSRHWPIWYDKVVLTILGVVHRHLPWHVEGLLRLLRRLGYSKGFALRALQYIGYSYEEAKQTVHWSKTWSDTFDVDERTYQAFRDLARHERNSPQN